MSIEYTAPPQSRNEAILADTINDVKYTDPPQSRIEDLLIDLNGKVIGKQDELTEEQLAAVNSGINSDKVTKYDDIYAVMNYNTMNHNGIYRGKDLTNIYTVDEIYERVHNGTFEDLYLGDYITITFTAAVKVPFTGEEFSPNETYFEKAGAYPNWEYYVTADSSPVAGKRYYYDKNRSDNSITVSLIILGFNPYYGIGTTNKRLYSPHIALGIVETPYQGHLRGRYDGRSTFNSGYYNSDIHQVTLPSIAAGLKPALNNHIITINDKLSDAFDATIPSNAGSNLLGATSGANWYDSEIQLMSEPQITGNVILSSSINDICAATNRLPIFNFINWTTYFYDKAQAVDASWTRSRVCDKQSMYITAANLIGYTNVTGMTGSFASMFLFG